MKVTNCSYRPVLNRCGLENIEFQVDPYVGCEHCCHYCYALKNAETDWSREIRIHEDIVGQLRSELKSIPPQTIYMGYETDPYQPSEAEYLQTRKVLELFAEKGFSVSILTKSDLFMRDVDLLKRIKGRISISVAFTDDDVRQLFEANTRDSPLRVEALRMAKEAGIHTATLVCPVIPYVSDGVALVNEVAPIADTIWIYGLGIESREGQNWKNIRSILDKHFPDKRERIEAVIFNREHSYWVCLRRELQQLAADKGLNLKIHL